MPDFASHSVGPYAPTASSYLHPASDTLDHDFQGASGLGFYYQLRTPANLGNVDLFDEGNGDQSINAHSGRSKDWANERQNHCCSTATSEPVSPETEIPSHFSESTGPASLQSLTSQQNPPTSDAETTDDDLHTILSDSEYDGNGSAGRYARAHTPLAETFCPFGPTAACKILYDTHGQSVPVTIHAKFARQYLENRGDRQPYHIMYRRNYFAVSINYSLSPPTGLANGNLYLNEQGLHQRVKALGVRMRAVKNKEHGEDVPISVFTAKRGPPMNPAPPLERELQPNMQRGTKIYSDSTGHGDDVRERPIHHTFQRLQFRKATENNGVRRRGQSFYHMVVELRASVIGRNGGDEWVKVASTISGPLLVRGRCPNSFEPYDPTNLKRRPQKTQKGRPKSATARPQGITKRRGPSKKQASKRATTQALANQRKRRRSSTETYDTTPTLTPGSHTRTNTSMTSIKQSDSPLMCPRDKIPPELRLPLPHDHTQLPTYTQMSEPSVKIQSPDPFAKYEDEYYQPAPYGEEYVPGIDVWGHPLAQQLSYNDIDFKIPDYGTSVMHSTDDKEDYDSPGADWQVGRRHF